MHEDGGGPGRRSGGEGLALALALVAIFGCCGLPLLLTLASSVAIGTLLGVGGGIVAAVALGAFVLASRRARRRACTERTVRRRVALHAGGRAREAHHTRT